MNHESVGTEHWPTMSGGRAGDRGCDLRRHDQPFGSSQRDADHSRVCRGCGAGRRYDHAVRPGEGCCCAIQLTSNA
jgi:hypothetical protein